MQQQMQQRQGHLQQHWVRRAEHGVLRVVSLGFSLASAHAIRWFFAPLDREDVLQPAITWVIAIGFGLLGYFVSRGLAHRLMNRERVLAYLPICIVVEVVEVVCNYALAAGVIQQATWLETIPAGQRALPRPRYRSARRQPTAPARSARCISPQRWVCPRLPFSVRPMKE